MTLEKWTDVDRYLNETLAISDADLDAVLAANRAANLPAIDVSPAQGKLLHLIARIHGARRILEVGTLGGYSTVWLARALPPDGQLITLEIDENHAKVARANLRRCGVASKVEIRIGAALDALQTLREEHGPPFDLTFIDADKQNNANYVRRAIELSRPGSVIIVDNVVRDGGIVDRESTDANVHGSRRVLEAMGRHPRLSTTAIQTVGLKGYDGFAIAIVEE